VSVLLRQSHDLEGFGSRKTLTAERPFWLSASALAQGRLTPSEKLVRRLAKFETRRHRSDAVQYPRSLLLDSESQGD
jgi:predicted DNA-binding ribbon-helix-helix protein